MIVHNAHSPASDLEARVDAVVLQEPAARARQVMQSLRVADVVTVDKVQGQPERDSGLDGVSADQIAAMNHRLGALRFRVTHCLRECVGAVVTVRDDADFHARMLDEHFAL